MEKMKILLSCGTSAQNYIDAIHGVGAEAVAKYSPEVDVNYDGLILCGGGDIDPIYYNEEICENTLRIVRYRNGYLLCGYKR